MADMKVNRKGEVTVNQIRDQIGGEAFDELDGWHFKVRVNGVLRNPSSFAKNEGEKVVILDTAEEHAEEQKIVTEPHTSNLIDNH